MQTIIKRMTVVKVRAAKTGDIGTFITLEMPEIKHICLKFEINDPLLDMRLTDGYNIG